MALLEAARLSKRFGDLRAVDNVDFHVDEGEFLSLVGSNGAGKTTLVNLISAHVVPDSGSILFAGRDITATTVAERIRAGIARSFQIVNLFDNLSVLDNVALSIFAREGKTRRAFALADGDRAVAAEARDVLRLFGLRDKQQFPASSLAQGERKLLDVAVAYALKPRVLFLDEPTSGVGTRDKAQIMDTVAAVVRAGGGAAVVVEHDMDIVFTYSDRVVVMHEGTVLAQGPPAEIRANRDVASVLLGTMPALSDARGQ
jgi:branched-chain amino acid transport system ATP-binding protein